MLCKATFPHVRIDWFVLLQPWGQAPVIPLHCVCSLAENLGSAAPQSVHKLMSFPLLLALIQMQTSRDSISRIFCASYCCGTESLLFLRYFVELFKYSCLKMMWSSKIPQFTLLQQAGFCWRSLVTVAWHALSSSYPSNIFLTKFFANKKFVFYISVSRCSWYLLKRWENAQSRNLLPRTSKYTQTKAITSKPNPNHRFN